jgi:hypothetical protein
MIKIRNFCYNLTTVFKCFRLKRFLFKHNEDEVIRFKANVKLTREMDLKKFIKNGRMVTAFMKAFLSNNQRKILKIQAHKTLIS